MKKFFQLITTLEDRYLISIAIVTFVLSVIIMFLEAISRYVLAMSFDWADELCRYCMVIAIFLSLPMAGKKGHHIRLEFFTNKFSLIIQKVSEKFTMAMGFIFWTFMLYSSINYFHHVLLVGETSVSSLQIPIWIIVLFVPVGSVLFLIYYLEEVIKNKIVNL